MDINTQELLEEAKKISENSYSPYSNFKVGACALYESGEKFLGTNIENVSYGLSMCAERTAISNAIIAGEKTNLKAIGIYSPNQKNCFPCGACRQCMSEFQGDKDIVIILEGENGEAKTYSFNEIFKESFKFNHNN